MRSIQAEMQWSKLYASAGWSSGLGGVGWGAACVLVRCGDCCPLCTAFPKFVTKSHNSLSSCQNNRVVQWLKWPRCQWKVVSSSFAIFMWFLCVTEKLPLAQCWLKDVSKACLALCTSEYPFTWWRSCQMVSNYPVYWHCISFTLLWHPCGECYFVSGLASLQWPDTEKER